MILHNDSSIIIYFGDSTDHCVKSDPIICLDYFEKIKKDLNLKKLAFLKQVHGANGLCIKDDSKAFKLFDQNGDFLVTNLCQVGIGVLTADCLPLVLYDPTCKAVAVIHASWKSAILEIVKRAISLMEQNFGSEVKDVKAFLGPCAKPCCYIVSPDFLKNLEKFEFYNQVILKKGEDLFFDIPKFVEIQLLNLGLKSSNIFKQYNLCTICNPNFFSYRRDNQTTCRQATIVALK